MTHLILVFLSLLSLVSADFTTINEYLNVGIPQFPAGNIIEMYTKHDSPTGDDEPYIEIDLAAKSINDTKMTGFFEVILLQSTNIDVLGYRDSGYILYCCTQEMYDGTKPSAPGCTRADDINTLLIYDGNRHHQSKRVYFNNSSQVRMKNKLRFSINNTGMHILIFSNCDPALQLGVQVDGEGEWRNPYGYLPGRHYGYLEFYKYMSCVYAVIGLIWFILNAYHWTEIMMVQNGITVVLATCMAEMTVWYFHYQKLNDTGRHDITIIFIAKMITVTRETLIRILILSISVGWGCITDALEKNKFHIILLGLMYWLWMIAFEIVGYYLYEFKLKKPYISEDIRPFVAIPIMIFNMIFLGWIMKSLNHRRKQTTFNNLYRSFILVFIASMLMRIVFMMYELHYFAANEFHWSQFCLVDIGLVWIVYTIILIAITILWRPHPHFRQFDTALKVELSQPILHSETNTK